MTEALATIQPTSIEAYEKALILGDLAGLKPEERINYYRAVCKSVGLNPLTKPFEYTLLNGKLLLYAKRDATDQLRKIHGVSVTSLTMKVEEGIAVATCHVTDAHGRTDVATGVVSLKGLQGNDLANAMMKVETKAKRRATLSIVGLGLLDETELETIRQDEPESARQSRREVERGTLEPSKELNRGHGAEGFGSEAMPTEVETGSINRTATGNDPAERARPKSDKPAAELAPLETEALSCSLGSTRLSPKQVEENVKWRAAKVCSEDEMHKGAPFYRVQCIGDTMLYVYDQHLFRAITGGKFPKKLGVMVQRGTKGLLQIKEIVHIDGVKFARDPVSKEAIPAELLSSTEKVINAPLAAANARETTTEVKPVSTQTAFQHGANLRNISGEVANFQDKDLDGDPLLSKSKKPFVIVTFKHLDTDPHCDPHATFHCFKEALFSSLKTSVGKAIIGEYSTSTDAKGRIWQQIESLTNDQEGMF